MTVAEPIGPLFDRLRQVLGWIGNDHTKMSTNLGTITFAFATTSGAPLTMKVKVEINSREHDPLHGFHDTRFVVRNTWFSGTATLRTYRLEELLGTKLRALHQRRKGRDLFDLDHALQMTNADLHHICDAFQYYMRREAKPLTKQDLVRTLAEKMRHPGFLGDVPPLLRPGITYDPQAAHARVSDRLIARLPATIVP